jgi:hypothetical protein
MTIVLKSISKEYLADLEAKIPELATSSDLVKLKLFSSEAALSKARKTGNSPDYIQISKGKILYPRAAVIQFFCQRFKQGAVQQLHNME